MIKSMTGFARKQLQNELGNFVIEIKSVNSRYLDISYKSPDYLRALEMDARNLINKNIARGKIECLIRWSLPASEQYKINHESVKAIVNEAKLIAKQYDLAELTTGELLRLPDIFVTSYQDDVELKSIILDLIQDTLFSLIKQRQSEGEYLEKIIASRLDDITNIVAEIAKIYKDNIENIKTKLNEKVAILTTEIAAERFEQELVYILQKSDIEEELDRLNGHLLATKKLLLEQNPVGRKLDFLLQEMNREINTIGSKSNTFAVSINAVELKVLLEQIREQIQNIE